MHNLLIYSLSPNLIIASRKNPNLYNFYVSTKIFNLQKNHVKMKKNMFKQIYRHQMLQH